MGELVVVMKDTSKAMQLFVRVPDVLIQIRHNAKRRLFLLDFYLAEDTTKEDMYAHALRSFQSTHDQFRSKGRTKFNKRLADN